MKDENLSEPFQYFPQGRDFQLRILLPEDLQLKNAR